jgi:hypothetical protein
MAGKTKIAGVPVKRGERMAAGKGWRVVSPSGKAFPATLLKRIKVKDESIAILRILPPPNMKKA